MNTSHSPTLVITDPMRASFETTGFSAQPALREVASDSFDTLYHSETAALDRKSQTKARNINVLDNPDENGSSALTAAEDSSIDTDALSMGQQQTPNLADREAMPQTNLEQQPLLAAPADVNEEPASENGFAGGISVALPENFPQARTGNKLPLGGKELPLTSETSEQDLLTTRPAAGSEILALTENADTDIQIRGRTAVTQTSARLRQGEIAILNSTPDDIYSRDQSFELAQAMSLSDQIDEGLRPLASKPVQEQATALIPASSSPSNPAASISLLDSAAVQKLTMAAANTESANLSADGRSVGSDWSHALREKVLWMRSGNISTAELHLHPAELGSIEIKIVTEDQQARVSFITSSAIAREVIEESLHRLKDQFADSGITLDQSDISEKEHGDEPTHRNPPVAPEKHQIEPQGEREFTTSVLPLRIGQVDQYV